MVDYVLFDLSSIAFVFLAKAASSQSQLGNYLV